MLVRETASRPGRARELLAASRRIRLRFLAAVGPLAVVSLALLDDAGLRWTLASFLPYAALRVETFTRSAVFKGLDRMDVEVSARALELAIALAGTAAVVAAGAPPWGIGLAFTAGAAAALAWVLHRQRELPAGEGGTAIGRAVHGVWTAGLPFLGIAVLTQLLLRLDALLMEALGLTREEIGRYGAAAVTTWAALAVPQLGALALYPTLSRAAARRRPATGPAAAAALAGLAIGGLAAGALTLLRRPLVRVVFGGDFAASAELLATVAWALPGASATMMVGTVLAAWHAQSRSLAWLVPTLATSVALNLAWIPELGGEGAARAAVVAHTFGALGTAALALTAGRVRRGAVRG